MPGLGLEETERRKRDSRSWRDKELLGRRLLPEEEREGQFG